MNIQAIYKFIIKPLDGKQYINTVKSGSNEIIMTTSIENHEDVQRYAEVLQLPLDYNGSIQVGDIVIVQHNVFRIVTSDWGVPMQSNNYISENCFWVDEDLIYLIIRNGEKIATDHYVFVEPILEKTKWEGEKIATHTGILRFPNNILKQKGLEDGDKVVFYQNSEYEFKIDDKTLYMMRLYRLLAKVK
jgi:co-chaperonin GroES (HSP10)